MPLNKPTGDMVNAGSNATPAALGTASAGTSTSYSRADHVHAKPTPADIGAISTTQLGALNGVATLDSAGKLSSAQIPALTSSQIAQVTPAAIGAMATSERAGLATLTAGTLTTTQVAALTGDVTSTAGSPVTKVVALQNSSLSTQSPALGQVLQWNGTAWTPATTTGGGGGGANGLTYYFNQGTAADAPTAGLPSFVKQLGRSGEATGSTVISSTLTPDTWTGIAGFVSESLPIDPDVTSIPAGIWDINAWAFGNANVNAGTSIRAIAYIYNGSILTPLGASGTQVINNTSAQYSLSILVQQTTVNLTDRIYIELQAQATASGHTATFQFGDGTPSHAHTSLPLVGGTGLWKSIDGTVQSPASLLVDADVASNAAIAVSKINGAVTTTQLAPYALTSQLANYVATSQLTTLATASGVPQLDSNGKISAAQIPSLTTSQITGLDSALASKVNTSQLTQLAVNGGVPQLTTAGTLSTVQIPALSYQAPLTTSSPLALTAGGTGVISLEAAKSVFGSPQSVTVRHSSAVTLATAGTISGATWTISSAVITFTSSTVTLVPGMSLSAGVTTGVIKTVDSATQITMTLTAGASGSGSITVYNSTVSSLVTSSTFIIDGKTLAVNDVVCLMAQAATAQNGPWVVSSIGSGFTMTRPSWFTGTLLGNQLLNVQYGSGNYSTFVSVFPNVLPTTSATIGIDGLSVVSVIWRTTTAVIGANQYTGTQTFAAGASTPSNVYPAKFQAGSLASTPLAHAIEWDGTSMYVTNASAVRKRLAQQEDRWTISATASTGVIAFAIDTQEVLYYTSNATADFTLNLTGASAGLNVGASRTVVFLNTNGTTAYKATAFQIDGVAVTPKYQGGSITGNASSVDMYSITIVKTAATPTYSAFVTLTKFA